MAIFTFATATLALGGAPGRIASTTTAEMDELSRATKTVVVADWPNRTGISGAGFSVESRPDGAEIINRVPYTFFVRDGLADSLIQTALERAEAETIDRITTQIDYILEEG